MSLLRLKEILIPFAFSILLMACTPLVPSNYLSPTTIQNVQKIDGQLIQPRLIPLSAETLCTPMGQTLLAPAMKPRAYRIGEFDHLNIIVWGHPDISTLSTSQTPNTAATAFLSEDLSKSPRFLGTNNNPAVLVKADGTIFYPFVGHLKIVGLTINEAQRRIEKRLARYIRHPQVTIQIAQYRKRNVYVLGEVKHPGMQPITDKPLSLLEAISNAGDINPQTADPSHIYLIRGSYIHPDIFWLNAQLPQSLIIAEQFPLQSNDIVYVAAASLTGLNNTLNQILPSVSTFIIARGLARK